MSSAYLHPTATVEREDQLFRVSVYWNGGVDRPCVGGYVLKNKKTADRLASAIRISIRGSGGSPAELNGV